MAAILCRRTLAGRVAPLTVGLTIGHFTMSRRQPVMRLDAYPSPSRPTPAPLARAEVELDDSFIDPDVLKQISGGSVSGFLTGLLVSVFSQTLVLVIGLTIVTIQIAARFGIDLVQQLRLKERAQSSRILSALREKTPFKLSFGLTFAMSAFMSF